jgi:hypothetical protein
MQDAQQGIAVTVFYDCLWKTGFLLLRYIPKPLESHYNSRTQKMVTNETKRYLEKVKINLPLAPRSEIESAASKITV